MTDTVVSSFERISDLALGADRDTLDVLVGHMDALDLHVRAAIALGTIAPQTLVDAKRAQMEARGTIAGRMNRLAAAALDGIDRLPADRPSRATLHPVRRGAHLVDLIRRGASAVTSIVRDHGEDVRAFVDGADAGTVDAHAIHIADGHLVVDGVDRWPLPSIVAETADEEEGLSVLTDDGRHVELRLAA